ncbi:hypothetical protein ABBQ38_008524 [Trebouxia sp. C0009 RCD-2024]
MLDQPCSAMLGWAMRAAQTILHGVTFVKRMHKTFLHIVQYTMLGEHCACPATQQQAVLLVMQAAIPELVASCLVLAVRYALDPPQPVLDLPALADLVTVPIGVLTHYVQHIEVRCLNVYLERLGALQSESSGLKSALVRAVKSPLYVGV